MARGADLSDNTTKLESVSDTRDIKFTFRMKSALYDLIQCEAQRQEVSESQIIRGILARHFQAKGR